MYVEGSSALETEKKQLKIVLGLFGGSYLVRCAFDVLVGFYLIEVASFCEEYPGFFELSQTLYFFLSDVLPIMALYRMHHQVYGDQEGQRQRVQMQMNPEAARAYHL